MHLKKIFFIALITTCSLSTQAQLSGGFESNSSVYIDDKKINLDQIESGNRFRSNTYLRLDYRFEKFTAGVQVESYEPKSLLNYSPNFKGVNLGTYYVNYKNDSLRLDLTAGHFYEQFGSGLVFRSWEDRQLGIANSIAGVRVKYAPFTPLQVTALYGKQRNGLGFDFTNSKVLGINAELDVANLLKAKKIKYAIGLNYVNRQEESNSNILPSSTWLTSVSGKAQNGGFSAEAEYAFKSADALVEFGNVRPDLQFDGDAYLFNVGYSKKGLGINLSMRRLENFAFYSQRNLAGNANNEGIVNYIPSLTKQHDYSLGNIYIYQAQPGLRFETGRNKAGEIGGQLDVIYQFKKDTQLGGKYGTNISLNFAQWHGLQGVYDAPTRRYKADLFAFGEKYYRETSIEIRKKWSPKLLSVVTYLNQYYNAKYVAETLGEVDANTGITENVLKVGKHNSVKLELQHQWATGELKNWAASQLEFNVGERWSFFALDLYNYGNPDPLKRIHFYNTGVVFKKDAIRVQTSYGRQRGGLVCVGGVCRFVPQSAGLNLALNASF
ncbi:DUF6029 family protein [Daejeonella sp.]|uniref:DUF6029 family protein n=1 Tax=Daejeonella sp. TaxID=2805397 RepID=UPI0030C0AF80